MKKKRGMLLTEETLKIVIAVIAIGFLVYFLVNLYFTNVGGKKLIEADANLNGANQLMDKIQGLEEGGQVEHLVQNPSRWRVMSFVDGEIKPNSCVGENCLCICVNKIREKVQASACDEDGVCGIVENLKEFGEIKIGNDGTSVIIRKVNSLIEIS